MNFAPRAIVALIATALAAGPVTAQYGGSYDPKPAKPRAPTIEFSGIKPSKRAGQAILDLHKAVTANDAAAIAQASAAAQAVASTKEDHYLIAQLQLKAAIARKDYAGANAALAAIRTSTLLPGAQVAQLYRGLGVDAYNAKQFDQAATMFEAAMAIEPQNLEPLTLLAETRIAQGRKDEGLSLLQKALQSSVAAGQKPSETIYRRVVQAAYNARSANAPELARQWLAAYPSKDSWRNAIAIYRNISKPELEGTLALMRLMRAAGALTPSDLSLYVEALSQQSNFIEAQTAVDQASAIASNAEVQSLAAELKSRPRPTAAELSAAAKSAQSGAALLRIGDRFYGLGEYAKAVEIYRQAMGKPGVDNNVANLHIGMALAAAGDKAGATTAFNAVSGPLSGPAQYWLLYLKG